MGEKTGMFHRCCGSSSKNNMYAAQGFLIRASIVLGMVAAVVTVLYFTPLPDQYFKTCDRPCHELDWPMICRVKLTLETYQTMSGSCDNCPNNLTSCDNIHCASADGKVRGIVTANRQLPGPSIQVCQNDILVVDVINKIPSHSITVHWRGQPQHEAPFMDGTPMITQCPITSYTTFQYKFRASQPGTHYWHAHSGLDTADGFFGALIVRQADKIEPHRKLYDVDNKEHVILISEWGNENISELVQINEKPKSLLINGKTQSEDGSSMSTFSVNKGKRYRFRVAYTGGISNCPVTLSVDKHLLKVIALDGSPITPHEISSFTIAKGERIDFVLKANQESGAYFLRVKSNCDDNEIAGLAVINYIDSAENAKIVTNINEEEQMPKIRRFDSKLCETRLGMVCLEDVHSLTKIPEVLKEEEVTRIIYLPFDYKKAEDIKDLDSSDLRSQIYRLNNLTFTYPPSPLLTQFNDVPQDIMCNSLSIPGKCAKKDICECVHIEHIPLGSSVELILIDQGGDTDEHIFHLHGYNFYVVGSRKFDTSMSLENVKELDEKGMLFKRNLKNPALKDTIRVPKYGVVALRFIAKNPGFWMLRDEEAKHWTRGLDVVFQVGEMKDMVSTPTNFPTCGSWIGPDFFLL